MFHVLAKFVSPSVSSIALAGLEDHVGLFDQY